jgi:hypothetical protein
VRLTPPNNLGIWESERRYDIGLAGTDDEWMKIFGTKNRLTRRRKFRLWRGPALVPCSPTLSLFKAARKGGTLEVKNLAEEGGETAAPKGQ